MDINKRVVFSFDERSYEPTEKLLAQRNETLDDYEQVPVRNPETGEERIVLIPKNPPRKCSLCGK